MDLHLYFVISLSLFLFFFPFFGICLRVESSSIVLVSPIGVKFTEWLSFYSHLKHSASAVIRFIKYKHKNSLVSKKGYNHRKTELNGFDKNKSLTEFNLLWGNFLSSVFKKLYKRRGKMLPVFPRNTGKIFLTKCSIGMDQTGHQTDRCQDLTTKFTFSPWYGNQINW